MQPNSVLFVCTGNTYRSVLAQKALENLIANQTTETWNVDSVGIIARPNTLRQCMVDFLNEKRIVVHHKQTKLECKMLPKYAHVVAMAQNHIEFMEERCGFFGAKLFNELAVGEKRSIWDVEDNVPDATTNEDAVCSEVRCTAEYIFNHTSSVFESIRNEPC